MLFVLYIVITLHISVVGALDSQLSQLVPIMTKLGGGGHRTVAGPSDAAAHKGQRTELKSEPRITTVHETLVGALGNDLSTCDAWSFPCFFPSSS